MPEPLRVPSERPITMTREVPDVREVHAREQELIGPILDNLALHLEDG